MYMGVLANVVERVHGVHGEHTKEGTESLGPMAPLAPRLDHRCRRQGRLVKESG